MGLPKLKLHKTAVPQLPENEEDALSSFAAEAEGSGPAPPAGRETRGKSRLVPYVAVAVGALLIAVAATIAFVATRPAASRSEPTGAAALGSVFIDSRPQGVSILIDGIAKGTTPSTIALPAGQHTLELKADGAARSFSLNVDAGATVSHYVELAATPEKPAASTGRLEVASDPPGAQVTIDGALKGRTPLSIADVQPGEHVVGISSGSDAVSRRVSVAAGNTATVFASLGDPETAAGWVAFRTPIDLEIHEGQRLVGTTATERLMLPAGRHELELVNTDLEFRQPLTVQVGAGSTVTTAVELPNGSLSLNALPWAEVTIDGRPVGTTPLGNLTVPIGTREIVWRHPQLGERRQTVKVPATTPVRVGVDMNK